MVKLNPKYTLYLILTIIVGVCLFYLFSLTSTPQTISPGGIEPAPPELPVVRTYSQQIKVSQISFSPNLVYPQIPAGVSIYTGSIVENDILLMANSLADKFKLSKKHPKYELWTDKNNTVSVTVDTNSKTLLFSSLKKTGKIYPIETLVKKAEDFVSLTKFAPDYIPGKSKIDFFKSDGNHYEQGSPDNFSLVTIPFAPIINDIPVIIDSLDIDPLSLSVNVNGEVEKAYFQDKLIKIGKPTESTKIISFDLLKQRISENKFQIIGGSSASPYITKIADVPAVDIFEIDLQYRFNSKTKIISPYFHLTGVSPAGDLIQILVNAGI